MGKYLNVYCCYGARVGVIHDSLTNHAIHARDVTKTGRFVIGHLYHITVNRVSSVRRPLAVITGITVYHETVI